MTKDQVSKYPVKSWVLYDSNAGQVTEHRPDGIYIKVDQRKKDLNTGNKIEKTYLVTDAESLTAIVGTPTLKPLGTR
jgi:hypothetical protein